MCRLLRKRKMAKVQPTRANKLKMPTTIPITELVLSRVPDCLDSGPGLNVVVDAVVAGIAVEVKQIRVILQSKSLKNA